MNTLLSIAIPALYPLGYVIGFRMMYVEEHDRYLRDKVNAENDYQEDLKKHHARRIEMIASGDMDGVRFLRSPYPERVEPEDQLESMIAPFFWPLILVLFTAYKVGGWFVKLFKKVLMRETKYERHLQAEAEASRLEAQTAELMKKYEIKLPELSPQPLPHLTNTNALMSDTDALRADQVKLMKDLDIIGLRDRPHLDALIETLKNDILTELETKKDQS